MTQRWYLLTEEQTNAVIEALNATGKGQIANAVKDQEDLQRKSLTGRLVSNHVMLRSILINQLLILQAIGGDKSVLQARLDQLERAYRWIKVSEAEWTTSTNTGAET